MTEKMTNYEVAKRLGDRLRELDFEVAEDKMAGSDLVNHAREEVTTLYHQWMAIHPDREVVLAMTEEE